MNRFIELLNESYVTFVQNLNDYGWSGLDDSYDRSNGYASGYEAVSPNGEIKCFPTYELANEWRISEIKALMEYERIK